MVMWGHPLPGGGETPKHPKRFGGAWGITRGEHWVKQREGQPQKEGGENRGGEGKNRGRMSANIEKEKEVAERYIYIQPRKNEN